MPAFGAARVEQKIVKVPENEIVVALGRSQPAACRAASILKRILAIHQQAREARSPGKPSCRRNCLICCGVDSVAMAAAIFGSQILNSAPARGDSSTISLPRRRIYANRDSTSSVGVVELWRSRPIIGNLRFDDDLVLVVSASAPKAVLQQTAPGQSPDQSSRSPCRRSRPSDANEASGRPAAQLLRAIRRAGAERSQADRIAIEAGDDVSVRLRFERDVTAQPGGKWSGVAQPRPRLVPGARKPDDPSGMGMKRVELAFRQRPVAQSELYRNIVKPARREAAIEMPQPRNDHSDDRDFDVGPRLIEDEEIEAGCAWRAPRRRSPARACREGRNFESRLGSDDRGRRSASNRDGPAAAMG